MSEKTSKQLSDIYTDIEEQRKTIKDREEGDKGIGKITDIQIGQVKDFVSEEALPKWKGNPNTQCMQITIETPDKTEMKQIITFSAHKNSNLQRWKRRNDKYPELNDEVKLRHDGNFWQLN